MVDISSQERKLLDCVRRGLRNEEIAVQLDASQALVAALLTSLLGKLEVSSRLELLLLLYSEPDWLAKRAVA